MKKEETHENQPGETPSGYPAFNIEEELKKLPGRPGVYIMHDAHDDIIYVGKAISLKNRVRQYFQSSRGKSAKILQMVERIRRFEYIVTDSELEALVLECNLIKEHRPKYNTMLKDDKTYPFIKVTLGEEYPRVLFSRTMKKDKSRYFGPYTSATAVKDTIDLVKKLYKIRSCSKNLPRDIGKERPCLYYQIGQCNAPCQGIFTKEEYRKSVADAVDFLNGNHGLVLRELEEKMNQASEDMEFEKAIEYRDLMRSIRQVSQRQKITSGDGEDKDVLALALEDADDTVSAADAVVQVFFIRGGKIAHRNLRPFHQISCDLIKYRPRHLNLQMLWLSVHCRDKWKIDRHDALRRKCLFRFLRRFAYPVKGNRIFCQIYFFLFPELLHDIICQLLIKIITAKMVVPRRCKYLDQSLSDLDQRNVKRTASQIVYHDLLWLSVVQAISQRRGSRFIDDPQHFKPCDPACILGRLTLRIIKISRNCDHRLIHRLAEITFCILFQLHQNIRRNFLWRITFSVNLFSPGRSHLPLH